LKRYLKDASLTDGRKLTYIGRFVRELLKIPSSKAYQVAWEIVYVELSYNSPLWKWWRGKKWWLAYRGEELKKEIPYKAYLSLVNSLKNSPLGKLCGQVEKRGREVVIRKEPKDPSVFGDFFPVPSHYAVGYWIARKATTENRNAFTVRELAEENLFGLTYAGYEKRIRALKDEKLISSDIVADLDNVFCFKTVGEYLEETIKRLENRRGIGKTN